MDTVMKHVAMIVAVAVFLAVADGILAAEPDDDTVQESLDLTETVSMPIADGKTVIAQSDTGRKRNRNRETGGDQEDDELMKLLEEADRMKEDKKVDDSINRVFHGQERVQAQLNPEISLTGDFMGSISSEDSDFINEPGDFTDGRNQFYLREAEFHVIAPLDPFTRGKFILGMPGYGEDVSLSEMVAEAYMEWLNLPAGLNLKIGKFNTQFGVLNRWHDHGLPQVDRPRALVNLFGTENFGGPGISGNIVIPHLWAHVNELDIEVVTGGDGVSFDDSYENVIGVARFKNYYDLTRNTYLEFGFSGAHGYRDKDLDEKTSLGGFDIACKWVPAGRSHYRTIELRSEVFFSHAEYLGEDLDRIGMYAYMTSKTSARTMCGMRYGYSELPYSIDDEYEWNIVPHFDFWHSEFVLLRAQYNYTKRSYDVDDHSVFLQTIWSMGPHKHEAY